MQVRLFRCKACNHRYRLGVSTCGYCFRGTALWNRWWFWLGVIAAAVAAAVWFSAWDIGAR
ncbi:hypothetical protein ACN2XU_03200 [Primorskyibacter sp. 2E107]|uniref:hypothetical protein n=1 Tax=Primorskyibacter sp. 2E107 TaxID=3403458 RepID=UPI003AF4E4ED